MAAEMSMNDLMKLQEAVMEIQMNVNKLLDMEMMTEEDINGMNDYMMGSGDMIGSGDIMTGSIMDGTVNEVTTE